MKRIGAGVVLVREDDKEINFYLHEDYPSFQTVSQGQHGVIRRMFFEKESFLSDNFLVCSCRKSSCRPKELIIEKDIEYLVKVFPYVVEVIPTYMTVSVRTRTLLRILENGNPEDKYRNLKRIVDFFLSVEPPIEENIYYLENYSKPIVYYTTVCNGERWVVVTKKEILKHSGESIIASFLNEVREKTLKRIADYREKTFLEALTKRTKQLKNRE